MPRTIDNMLRWHEWNRRLRPVKAVLAGIGLLGLVVVALQGFLAASHLRGGKVTAVTTAANAQSANAQAAIAQSTITQSTIAQSANVAAAEAPIPLDNSTVLAATFRTSPELPQHQLDAADRNCLASAIYHEARGEPADGQIAVAQVVLNRTRSGRWPSSICAVVNQGASRGEKCQFSFACRKGATKPKPGEPGWDDALALADAVASGQASVPALATATHYHTTDVHPVWRLGLNPVGTIGQHIFYTDDTNSRQVRTASTDQPAESTVMETRPQAHAVPQQARKTPVQKRRRTADSGTAARGSSAAPSFGPATVFAVERY